jgi:hypothetical protein
MSARACPKCRRELPETTLRALAQGAPCPFCATPLKTKPRRAPETGPADQEYAAFELSTTPPPAPPPQRSSGAAPSPLPGVTAPRAMPPAPVAAPPAPAQRPAPAQGAPAAPPPVERRPAPTMVGIAPPPPEKASPPPRAPSPVVQPSPSPSPSPIVQPAPARQQPAPERPSVPLAMSAALPATGPTAASFALAMPAMALPPRSRRNLAIAGGAAALVVAVAILVLHHPSADRLPVESAPPAIAKPTIGAAPLATLEEKSPAAPKIEPLHPAAVAQPKLEAAGDAPASATEAAPAKVRGAHHATAHKRHAKHERYAKRERHEKHARHEKRTPRRLEAAAEPAPSPAAEGDARATYQKGNALLFAGDAAGAVSAYKKAVELAPKDPIGYRGLGLAYEQQGATKPAIRALRKYLKLAPAAADREIISRRIARLAGAAH